MNNNERIFRCGMCGQPTDKEGTPLSIDECKQLTEEQLFAAILIYGDCCPPQEDRTITVTRDMAIDAGDLSLEGQTIPW